MINSDKSKFVMLEQAAICSAPKTRPTSWTRSFTAPLIASPRPLSRISSSVHLSFLVVLSNISIRAAVPAVAPNQRSVGGPSVARGAAAAPTRKAPFANALKGVSFCSTSIEAQRIASDSNLL